MPPVTSPMTAVKVRKLLKRDGTVSEIVEGGRVIYRTEELASRTNPQGTLNDTDLDREAGLHREFVLRVASPSEGGPRKVRQRSLLSGKSFVLLVTRKRTFLRTKTCTGLCPLDSSCHRCVACMIYTCSEKLLSC